MDGCINDREPARTSDFIKSHYSRSERSHASARAISTTKTSHSKPTSLMLTTASFTPRLLTRLSKTDTFRFARYHKETICRN